MKFVSKFLILFLASLAVASAEERPDPELGFRFQEAIQRYHAGELEEAAAALKKLAVAGHGRSQYWLAQLYYRGTGVPQSEQQGALWIERAAASGYPIAMVTHVEILLGRDEPEAHYKACLELLQKVLAPETTARVSLEEFGLYRQAKSRSSYLLGLFHYNGWGVDEDAVRAIELFHEASRSGNKEATMSLAIEYAKGEHVERDVPRAKELFELFDLQSIDAANRNLEAAIGGSADAGDRDNLLETSDALGETISDGVSAALTLLARDVLAEDSEDHDPELGITLLRFAADRDYAEAQLWLGAFLYEGRHLDQDEDEAARLFEAAARQGWPLAQFNWAALLRAGLIPEPEDATAAALLESAAARGLYVAQRALDEAADIEPLSPQQAFERCEQGVAAADPRAFFSMAVRKTAGWMTEVETDFSKILELYQKSADGGFKRAQYVVGMMKIGGAELPQDIGGGVGLVSAAAYQDLPEALHAMGTFRVQGIGIPQDPRIAFDLFTRAAELGHQDAYNSLALFYLHGILVPRDEYKAAELYLIAAGEGDAAAAQNLGNAFLHGKGVPVDAKQGMAWIQRAAELGSQSACLQLAFLYEENLVVAQDLVEAAFWQERAAELGHKHSMRKTAFNYHLAWGHPKNRGKALYWIDAYLAHPGPVDPNRLYYTGQFEDYGFVQSMDGEDFGALQLRGELLAEPGWSGSDVKRGEKILQRLADRGSKGATLSLAELRLRNGENGRDARESLTELKALYQNNQDAAVEGNRRHAREAAYLISRYAAAGLGSRKQAEDARKWLAAAAELGHAEARFELGIALASADDATASHGIVWLLKSARAGDARAQLWIARRHLVAPLGSVDSKRIIEWLKELVDSGSGEARLLLKQYGVPYKDVQPAVPGEPQSPEPDAAPDPWAPVRAA